MARKSRAERFAPLEDESIRQQIPKKILPLIEQLVTEQCVPVTAALTLRMKLLEIQVRELEQRLNKLDPQPPSPMATVFLTTWPAELTTLARRPSTRRAIPRILGKTMTTRTTKSHSERDVGKDGVVFGQPQAVDRAEPFPVAATAPGYKSGNGRRNRPKSTQETSTSGRLAGSLLYSTVRPRQFIVVPLNQPPEKPARAGCTHHSNRRPLPQATPLPRCRLRPQPHPTTDYRRLRATPQPPDLSIGPMASQPFRCGDCARHHP